MTGIRGIRLQLSIALVLSLAVPGAFAAGQPSIILILANNFGYGKLGSCGGGITCGAATPRRDELACQGTRLTSFNVESFCTSNRSALMTGRHPIRSGTHTVPVNGKPHGLVQWEVTMAGLLSGQSHATAHFGKWHLGGSQGRYPNEQGFDAWYGIPNSSDESLWAQQNHFDPTRAHLEYLIEGREGEPARKLEVYEAFERREIDAERAIPRLIDLHGNPQETVEESLGESSLETRRLVVLAIYGELVKLCQTFKTDPPVPMGMADPHMLRTSKAPIADAAKLDATAAID